MVNYHINIFCSQEDGGCIADIPDLDSGSAFGQTAEQALAEVKQVKGLGWKRLARQVNPFHRPVITPLFTRCPGDSGIFCLDS
jgi:predicted RNase H-like HicB family nuclease